MTTKASTFLHALRCANWGDPDEHPGAVAQRIVRGKQVEPSIFYDQDPTILNSPTGYDYAKHEEWRVFAWDDDFFYLQENCKYGTEFIQVPKNPSAYYGVPIVIIDWEENLKWAREE